jgi:hypothetical protein
MLKRSVYLCLLAMLMGALGGGCKRAARAPSLPPAPPVIETVMGLHWVGKQNLTTDTNAASLLAIWNLPESKTLEAQMLDRLAVGLLALSRGGSSNLWPTTSPQSVASSNASSVAGNRLAAPGFAVSPSTNRVPLTGSAALLRPLLEDLLEQESFVNVRQATNQPGEVTLAIRLSEARACLWETNLAALLESWTAGHAAAVPGRSNGWQLKLPAPQPPASGGQPLLARTCELARVGDWTVVGWGPGSNQFFGAALSLFQQDPRGQGLAPTNVWLFSNIDPRRAAQALSLNWDLPELPRISLGVTGDGQAVRTRAQLSFAQPLPFELEPWNIPTNLIHDPLVSFTAVQGLRPWLSSSPLWRQLDLGPPPNQLYCWAQGGLEYLSFFAAPLADASNSVERVTEHLLQKPNDYLAAEGLGRFARATNGPGVIWSPVLFATPHLEPVSLSEGEFVFGGLVPNLATNKPPPADLLRTVVGTTNLVAYDWELSGPRLHQWLYFGQLIRYALHLAQVPPKSASFAWLKALEPKLGNSVTAVTRPGPEQLSFTRRSDLGLTAAELFWLADWLESPQFPRGLNTFLGQPTPLPRPLARGAGGRTSTNVPPATPR